MGHKNTAHIQENDFRSLTWGKLMPTDVDGLIEFGGKLFIFIELKYEGSPIPRGQELALTRACDAIQLSAPCYVLHASHSTPIGSAIDVGRGAVIGYYHGGQWHQPRSPIRVREAIEKLRTYHRIA